MRKTLYQDISEEARQKAEEFNLYHNTQHLEYQRNCRRIQNPPPKDIKTPEEWLHDKKFNPFYVLGHVNQISKSITKQILNGTYKPMPPFKKEIPKRGGGVRTISIYQIPDSAVSDRFYKNLLAKNKHRFSSLTYAYRDDRNVHYAIQDIAYELSSTPRIFIAEFDFSKFFDSIKHTYIREQLERNSFLVSDTERKIIDAFLDSPSGIGIPLGTSISLFLANVSCWSLDRAFEDEGLRFARYADDTIVWSKDYNKICKAFDIINSFSIASGIGINFDKSDGISILQRKGMPGEFKVKAHIEFLGYEISPGRVSIKYSAEQRIKKQISYILYRNLIQPIKTKPFRGVNHPANEMDKDFVTAIMQVRRYLYGNLSEVSLKKYIIGVHKRLIFKGIMSFYPLINDEDQLRRLNKWMVSTIINVLRRRLKFFQLHGYTPNPNEFPFGHSPSTLIRACKNKLIFNKSGLIEIPSFLRIYRAIKIGLNNDGIEKVMNRKSTYSYQD